MELVKTELEGVYIIKNFNADDNRGSFVKTFHKEFFKKHNLCTEFNESYFSISKKDVIRGMHFQLPPFDHEKLVYVPKGKILDVILDLRKNSKTYGKSISVELSDKNRDSIYIPKGLAHGFMSLENETITVYNVAAVYEKDADYGIMFNSFKFDWQCTEPIMSERDKKFVTFDEFEKTNPF